MYKYHYSQDALDLLELTNTLKAISDAPWPKSTVKPPEPVFVPLNRNTGMGHFALTKADLGPTYSQWLDSPDRLTT